MKNTRLLLNLQRNDPFNLQQIGGVNMFFRKKKEEEKELCFHEWQLADFSIFDNYNGVDVDIEHKFEIGCHKCKRIRTVDSYEFNRMRELGLIKQ